MQWKQKKCIDKTSGRWFAWYPVLLCNDDIWVWLEFVDWVQPSPAYQVNYYVSE